MSKRLKQTLIAVLLFFSSTNIFAGEGIYVRKSMDWFGASVWLTHLVGEYDPLGGQFLGAHYERVQYCPGIIGLCTGDEG